jgi:hypothetical protein
MAAGERGPFILAGHSFGGPLQLSLASLSENATVTFIAFDHDMQKTIPATVAKTIVTVVNQIR